MIYRKGYPELGLYCADICKTLDRGLNYRQADRLSRPVSEAIEQLATWVEANRNAHHSRLAHHARDCRTVSQIQKSAVEPDKRNPLSRVFNAKNDKDRVTAWRSDLDRILHIFEVRSTAHSLQTLLTVHLQTELALHTHVAISDVHEEIANTRELVSDMHRAVLKDQEGADGRNKMVGRHGVLFMIEKFLRLP